MSELTQEVQIVSIEDELKQSYLDYAMSVIIGRALPDVRDGLKPVHRRVLYAMNELGNEWNKPYKKSARVVGDVIGKYHPHGETAVYDSIVRMAQDFSMRYMLIDGQGNFGSVDGDPPAAMRYTEVRMAKITQTMLADLDKDTVDFVPNYDDSEQMPAVLPTRLPNLLVNGSSGIAVGMATNIPSHNLKEVISACIALLDDPEISIDKLMRYIPGPDFPTAGIITGRAGIEQAYRTGKGRIHVRSRTVIESEKGGKQTIVVNELPYQVNKARLIEKIAELVKDKKIEGITALRDESDKDGMRIVIELRRGENADVMLNNLYSQTQMQVVFGINMVALVDDVPRLLNIKEVLQCFLDHRCVVVTRRTEYELKRAYARAHILEGLSISLENLDAVIELIKTSVSPDAARNALLARPWRIGGVDKFLEYTNGPHIKNPVIVDGHYKLSEEQVQAILDLKLQRLTGLEQEKIWAEFREIVKNIQIYQEILRDHKKLISIVRSEILEVGQEFSDKRRTEIADMQIDLSVEDLIPPEDMVVTLSHGGYVKAQPVTAYQAQHRGGRGKIATLVKEEDFIAKLVIANTHDLLLCFTNLGQVFWLKVHQIPVANRMTKGKPIINLLSLREGERVNALLPVRRQYDEQQMIFMATSLGVVKQVPLSDFQRPRNSGIIAIDLKDGDTLVGVELTMADQEIMLFTNSGKAIRFNSQNVREMGRTARGVRGIKLGSGQKVVSLIALKKNGTILIASENGYGKRTESDEFSVINRGGQGVIAMRTTARNGQIVGALQVGDEDELILISDQGTLVRIKVSEISTMGRNTQGVTLINLGKSEHLVGIQKVAEVGE